MTFGRSTYLILCILSVCLAVGTRGVGPARASTGEVKVRPPVPPPVAKPKPAPAVFRVPPPVRPAPRPGEADTEEVEDRPPAPVPAGPTIGPIEVEVFRAEKDEEQTYRGRIVGRGKLSYVQIGIGTPLDSIEIVLENIPGAPAKIRIPCVNRPGGKSEIANDHEGYEIIGTFDPTLKKYLLSLEGQGQRITMQSGHFAFYEEPPPPTPPPPAKTAAQIADEKKSAPYKEPSSGDLLKPLRVRFEKIHATRGKLGSGEALVRIWKVGKILDFQISEDLVPAPNDFWVEIADQNAGDYRIESRVGRFDAKGTMSRWTTLDLTLTAGPWTVHLTTP